MSQDQRPEPWLRSTLNRNAVRLPAQGWRCGYPGITDEIIIQPQSGCVISSTTKNWAQPPCGWGSMNSLPRVAESGNPRLEGATALRFRRQAKGLIHLKKSTLMHQVLPPKYFRNFFELPGELISYAGEVSGTGSPWFSSSTGGDSSNSAKPCGRVRTRPVASVTTWPVSPSAMTTPSETRTIS